MITFEELCEELCKEEECYLLDILEITSEEVVARFRDRIEEKEEELRSKEYVSEEDETDIEF